MDSGARGTEINHDPHWKVEQIEKYLINRIPELCLIRIRCLPFVD